MLSALALFGLALLQLAAAQVYFVDDSVLGRTFEGIGGLSGGGATSKLLPNYPEKQRNEILDYLFLPNFGASLQILKVEIGGDTQSTEGTEASHMHSADDLNFARGYESWLMVEAKKRNPNIKLYGLAWGFPGWVGNATNDGLRYPNVTAKYVTSWIAGQKQYFNLTIDYIGIWNEKGWGPEWVVFCKVLRATLDAAGFSNVRIIASDSGWDPASDVLTDAALSQVVYALGCHYPGMNSDAAALLTEKPLWASEDWSTFNDDVGSGCWARLLNRNYVNGLMTSTISWNAIAAYYDDLPYARCGLMTANSPWSGNYEVSGPIWISAHTTQFTQIGWSYLRHGSGVGTMKNGGTYVSLVSPDHSQFTMVIETASYNHSLCIRANPPPYPLSAQTATFVLKGKLASITKLNVWRTRLLFGKQESAQQQHIAQIRRELDTMRQMQLRSSQPKTFETRVSELEKSLVAAMLKHSREQGTSSSQYFQQIDPISVQNGQFTLQLNVDEVYTLSTVETATRGTYGNPPAASPFPIPYTDNFQQYAAFVEPYNLVPQVGSFEVRDEIDCPTRPVAGFGLKDKKAKRGVLTSGAASRHVHSFTMKNTARDPNRILVQTVTQQPVYWCACGANPIAVIGNYSWSSGHFEYYGVLPDLSGKNATIADGLMIAALVNKGGCDQPLSSGLFLWLLNSAQKLVMTSDYLGKQVLNSTDYDVLVGTVYQLTLIVDRSKNIATGTVVDPHQHSATITLPLTTPGLPNNGFVAIGTYGWGYACYDELVIQTV